MYSAPESRAVRSKVAVLRMSSLACSNSRRWWWATSGSPMTLSRSRTGGGPPSGESGDAKKRETEKVEHGGDAMMAM
eukprot:4675111-Pleurochrysis_carterae.AAC.1